MSAFSVSLYKYMIVSLNFLKNYVDDNISLVLFISIVEVLFFSQLDDKKIDEKSLKIL